MPDPRKETEPAEAPSTNAPDPWITLNKASGESGLSRYLLLKAAARGDLEVDERGGITFVTRASVARLKARLDTAGADAVAQPA